MLKEHCRTQNKIRHDLGELIFSALADDEIYEVMLNPDGIIWVDGWKGKRPLGCMAPAAAKNLINTVASIADEAVTASSPSFAGELWVKIKEELQLFRFQALIPPVVAYPAFTIRKRAGRVIPLKEFVKDGILSLEQEQYIQESVQARRSMLIIGGTQSGKTTLTNAVLNGVAQAHPDDRIIIIEDTQELKCQVKDCVTMRSSPAKSMNALIYDSLRMRPDRIIIGEVRGPEAHTLLKAWNTGHSGGICTIHANSAESGLLRIEQLVQEAGVVPVPAAIVEAVNVVVYIQKDQQAAKGRKVTSLLRLTGYNKDQGYLFSPCP